MPKTLKSQKTESVVASTRTCPQPASRGAPITSEMPNYSQTGQMWLLPVVQADAMRPLTPEQALAAAASGTAIVRADCARAAMPAAQPLDFPRARA